MTTPKLSTNKRRWVRNRDVYLKGLPLYYSAPLRAQYESQLRTLVARMAKDVQAQVTRLFKSDTAQEFRKIATMDASITAEAKKLMGQLSIKYEKLFGEKSGILATQMVDGAQKASAKSWKASQKKLTGMISLKSDFIPKGVKPIVSASIAENVNLITSIPEKYLTNITGAVMRSITTGGGVDSLTKTMKKYYGETDRRASNVALDQTRKAYNTINKQRMITSGYKKFEWLHSGGGLHPRKDHIAMNGKVYSFDKLPIIDKKTGERGIPGQAINCGCTMLPVYEFPKGEE